MSILESIASAFSKKKRDEQITIASLARDIADGRTPEPTKAAEALRVAGQTPEQLQAAVDRILRRRKIAAQIAANEKTLAEGPKIAEAIDKATQEHNAAVNKFNSTVGPLLARQRELDVIARQTEQLRNAQREVAPEENIDAVQAAEKRTTEASNALNEMEQKRAKAQHELTHLQSKRDENRRKNVQQHPGNVAELDHQIGRLESAIAEADAAIPRLEAEFNDAQNRLAKAEATLLQVA